MCIQELTSAPSSTWQWTACERCCSKARRFVWATWVTSLLLGSKGAETADKFTAQNINQVKVQWEPGKEFKNLLDDAEFNLVASRSAQAAVLKAIKDGKSTVDLNAPIDPDGGDDGNDGGNNGGGSTTGGGSNAGGSGTTGSEGDNKDDTGTSGGNTGEDKGNTDSGSNGDNEHITL